MTTTKKPLYVLDILAGDLPMTLVGDAFISDMVDKMMDCSDPDTFTTKLESVCIWVRDVALNTIIELPNYSKTYFGFKGQVSQKDLDTICYIVSKYFLSSGEIFNSMGEITPSVDPLNLAIL